MSTASALRTFATILLWALLALAAPARANDRLLLLVNAQSPVMALNSVEVHKLFLGLTVVVEGRRLRALRNDSDALMRRVFFQSIVSMSEPIYDRRMLSLTLQQGRTAPPVYNRTKDVLDALAGDVDAVSFAWGADAAQDARVRPLRVIWHP